MRGFAAGALMIGAVLLVPGALAHDMWLIPDEAAAVGKVVTVRCNSGMDFPKSESAPDPAKFKRRLLVRPDGSQGELQAAGQKDDSGLLQFTPEKAGIYVAAVETNPRLITLQAEAFNAYLITTGMPQIYLTRANEKKQDQPGKERYSKHVKAIVAVGEGAGEGDPSRIVGLRLEIVPLADPLRRKKGDTLPVRVLFDGKPLPDAHVGWQHPGDGTTARGYVRTDAKGEALIPVARTGLMTIRLTHMTRPQAADFEWESFWSTLTFRVKD